MGDQPQEHGNQNLLSINNNLLSFADRIYNRYRDLYNEKTLFGRKGQTFLSFFDWPQTSYLYPCFCPTDITARIFHRNLLSQWKVDLYIFFPWLGVDPIVVLHLKEGQQGTHHWLNRTKKKKKKAHRKATSPWLGFETANYVFRAERSNH